MVLPVEITKGSECNVTTDYYANVTTVICVISTSDTVLQHIPYIFCKIFKRRNKVQDLEVHRSTPVLLPLNQTSTAPIARSN